MIRWNHHRLMFRIIALMLLSAISSYASAGIVDGINVHTNTNGNVEVTIKFSVPIKYQRHYPKRRSATTSIYFNTLASVPAAEWQKDTLSDLIQNITVSTKNRRTGPMIKIKFNRPVRFAVGMGENNRVLLIRISPGVAQSRNISEPATIESEKVAVPIVVPPKKAAIPLVSKPSVSIPTVSSTSAKKVEPAKTAPVLPSKPVVPSGDVTPPKVVLPRSRYKPIRIPLGQKDGLPDYPLIERGRLKKPATASGKLSLADQVMNTNLRAATLMKKGGRAILAGQPITAIEAYNKVLRLPPNKYSQHAQLWIGIARGRSGQTGKAILEFKAYLKIYPKGESVKWVEIRLRRLKIARPELFVDAPKSAARPTRIQNTEFRFSESGSISTYYYYGGNRSDATDTSGSVQSPIYTTNQSTLMTNIFITARAGNNEYDNRLVFQKFHSWNFLPGQRNSDRVGSAYYEMKNRIVNYSVKIGRQSAYGGGVMGRFEGILAGYGFARDWKANVVYGKLYDYSVDSQPKFKGVSVDFGTRSPLGGSVYFIDQTISGFTDRRAVGGNLRYFDRNFNVMSMVDYDVLFKALNMITVQGTVNNIVQDTDFNFLLDRRRSPTLDVRNAVNGTAVSIAYMTENGMTTEDLIEYAKLRTATSSQAQLGMTNRLNKEWSIGTDFSISDSSGLPRSGGITTLSCSDSNLIIPSPTEGCVDATPSSGNTWTISERATGLGVFKTGDVTNFSLSYSKGPTTTSKTFQVNNHADLQEKKTLDTALSLSVQNYSTGKSYSINPSAGTGYRLRKDLTIDGRFGINYSKTMYSNLNSSTSIFGWDISFGGSYNF